jgi:hypothetical protein
MDPHDPLKIMRLSRGIGGYAPEPTVGLLPRVLISGAFITGVGFLFFGDFVWKYAPLFGWQGWTPTLKLVACIAVGGIISELLINVYESNHKWEHGSVHQQIMAIRG